MMALITSALGGVDARQGTPPVAALCALLSAACWGFGIVAAKASLEAGTPPLTLVAVQLAASVAALSSAALLFVRRVARPEPAHARGAALSGVLEYGATYALAALGLAFTTAGNAAIIGAAEPALIVLAAAIILGERAGRRLLGLLALVTAGLVLVALPDLASTGTPGLGDILVLASATTGAVYAVLCRRLVVEVAPLPLALLQQAAGLAAVLSALMLATLAGGWASLGLAGLAASPAALGLAILSGLLQHGAAVWLHLHALKRMPAGVFALFLALVPLFALVAASFALGETITPAQLAGGTLVTTAAALAGRAQPPSRHRS
jgi:drug/metabolite transporter (DMT)-like permease